MIIKVGNQIVVVGDQLIDVSVGTSPTPTPTPTQGNFKIGAGSFTPALSSLGGSGKILFPTESTVLFPSAFTSASYSGLNFVLADTSTGALSYGTDNKYAITGPAYPRAIIYDSADDGFIYLNTNSITGSLGRKSDTYVWDSVAAFGAATGYTGRAYNITYDPATEIIYAGGNFATYDSIGARRLVAINAQDGTTYSTFDTTTAFTTTNGLVYRTILDGNGGLIVIGSTLTVYNGNSIPNNCVRLLLADGTVDASFNEGGTGTAASTDPITDGFIDSANEHLYLASTTTSFDGVSTYGAFRLSLNSETFGQIDETWIPAADGPAVFYDGSPIYIHQDTHDSDLILIGSQNAGEIKYISKTDATVTDFWDYWVDSSVSNTFKGNSIYDVRYNSNDGCYYMSFNSTTIDETYYINKHGKFRIEGSALVNETSNELPDNW
jgi:hypothetical protein